MKLTLWKRFCIMMITFLLIIPIISCSSKVEVIKIGFSFELTGPNSELGRDAMYGSLIAIQEINDAGGIDGKKLELVIKDDLGNPDEGVKVDNELIEEGCVAIIGHGTSLLATKTIENANTNNFILFSPTISSSLFDNIDDNFFRMIPSNLTQGASIADFMYLHSPGEVTILIESTNISYTQTISDSFIDAYNETEYLVDTNNIHSFVTRDLTSYQTAANTINNSTVTNAFIIGSSYDVSSILQEGIRSDVNIFVPVWATTLDIFSSSGTLINNSHGINYFDLTSINPAFIRFLTSYEETYGITPSFSSMFSYESVMTLAEALRTAKSYQTVDIKAALVSIGSVSWLIDEVLINQFGDCERRLYWYHFINGTFAEVTQ